MSLQSTNYSVYLMRFVEGRSKLIILGPYLQSHLDTQQTLAFSIALQSLGYSSLTPGPLIHYIKTTE